MHEDEFLENVIKEEIQKYQRQIIGIQRKLGMRQLLLKRLQNGVSKIPPKVQQLDLFGT